MKKAVAVAALLICLLLVGISEGSTPVKIVPRTGSISLVGTLTDHYLSSERVPDRHETFRFALASIRVKGKTFGWAILSCDWISRSSTLRECTGTFSLPQGRIMVNGSLFYNSIYQLAVTGGTDIYLSVSGVLGARVFAKVRDSFWFTFTLT